ncbi:MAG TPA: pteridine reductase [Gammaproteobacteria bacterium]|nr:pteridine reductase [Gammaproteobacteria bacterium]
MKTALITGGAQRIGAQIAQTLHNDGYNIIIHYRHSKQAAETLAQELNTQRNNSATTIQAELSNLDDIKALSQSIERLDVLVNNASVFYPTPVKEATPDTWYTIMNTNLMAPFFLSQSLTNVLNKTSGCIINLVDIHAQRPLKNHAIYNISKAGIAMMTKTLAKELAPNIRVCGVSPGSIIWPENEAELTDAQKNKMLNKIALGKQGSALDIANTVLFLANSSYITGQIISVDGGRTLNQ